MARAILDETDKRTRLVEQVKNQLGDNQIRALVAGTDVVPLSRLAFVQEQIKRFAMVVHKKTVAYLLTVAIDRDGLIVQSVSYAKRYELLDVLARPYEVLLLFGACGLAV